VKTIDEAYDKYDTTKDEISAKKKEKDELIKEVEKQITSYGF
jgi:prefoldin subunit 5